MHDSIDGYSGGIMVCGKTKAAVPAVMVEAQGAVQGLSRCQKAELTPESGQAASSAVRGGSRLEPQSAGARTLKKYTPFNDVWAHVHQI